MDEGEACGLILSSSEAILAGADVTEEPPWCSGMAFAAEIRGPSTIEDVCGLRSTYESKGDTGSARALHALPRSILCMNNHDSDDPCAALIFNTSKSSFNYVEIHDNARMSWAAPPVTIGELCIERVEAMTPGRDRTRGKGGSQLWRWTPPACC